MQVVRLHPDRELRLHDEPVPEPGPGEVLVRVAAVGLCGSDRHWALEGGIGDAQLERPLVLGHEFAGVADSGRFAGRFVAADPAVPCDRCRVCESGRSNLCPNVRFAGHGVTDGALREWVAWPEHALHPLPDTVPSTSGALVEPLSVAIHATDLAGTLDGARVGVVGCGPIGLLAVALARRAGAADVLAVEPLAHRRAAAVDLGATAIEPEPTGSAASDTCDVVIDAAGEDDAIATAIDLAAPGAVIVLAGIPSGDVTSFRASAARRKGLAFRLVRRSTADAFGRAAGLVAGGAIDLSGLVTLRVPLADATRGFAALVDRSGIKVVVEPTIGSARTEDRAA
jgi:L-iditol 2-dehydrogenase